MENHLLTSQNYFNITILTCIIVATIISFVVSAFFNPVFMLDENQILYLFSAMGQIIAGLFGLTLTAYVFFVDKFRESTEYDDTYYDATNALLEKYFYILIVTAIICGTTIIMCIVGIVTLHSGTRIYHFIINESVLLFLIGIGAVLTFGAMLLDPQKLEKENARMRKKAERNFQSTDATVSGDFTEFLKTYNQLEQVIIELAKRCVEDKTVYYRNYKPQIIQSLKVLTASEIIDGALAKEINELRMYRNALVHGLDFNVTQDACKRISQIYNALRNVFDLFKNGKKGTEEWKIAINQVRGLAR